MKKQDRIKSNAKRKDMFGLKADLAKEVKETENLKPTKREIINGEIGNIKDL